MLILAIFQSTKNRYKVSLYSWQYLI